MDEYNFLADLLNKYLQMTPWVQALIGLAVCGMILGVCYFFKESVIAIMKPFCRPNKSELPEEKKKEKE